MNSTDITARINELEARVSILNRLADISVTLNSTLEVDALLSFLMDAAAAISDAEAASVLLWDEDTRELRFAATTSRQSDLNLLGSSVPLEGSIAGTIFRDNQILQVDDALNDPRRYTRVDEENQFQTRSLLGVPMRLNDRVIGVLEIINKRKVPWTQADRDYQTVLAAQAAVAIERARLVSDLQKANQELSELDKLKNDFIAIASHELRTPLSVILGYASFLRDEAEGQGRISEHAEKVMDSGLQLRRIIEDLMNLRYLQQNPSELHLETVSLNELLQEASADVMTMVVAQGHALEVVPAPDARLRVDRIRAVMALTNVLNNAVRFTPDQGHILLRAQVRGDEAWISVTDNGLGLASDQLERIFDQFYQVEDHMTRRHGGLGIGLSIARALVQAHGGRIWAVSPGVGQGSTFTLALPLTD